MNGRGPALSVFVGAAALVMFIAVATGVCAFDPSAAVEIKYSSAPLVLHDQQAQVVVLNGGAP